MRYPLATSARRGLVGGCVQLRERPTRLAEVVDGFLPEPDLARSSRRSCAGTRRVADAWGEIPADLELACNARRAGLVAHGKARRVPDRGGDCVAASDLSVDPVLLGEAERLR